jgi:hypothetical protein
MYIKKRLLGAFIAAGFAAATVNAARTDRYKLDQGSFTFDAYDTLGIADDSADPLDEGTGFIPYFYNTLGSEDESVVMSFLGTYPKALKLNTEDDTINFKVKDKTNLDKLEIPQSEEVYIETTMQFVLSDDDPLDFGDAKIALWVNAESNLVIRHGMPIWDGEYIVPGDAAPTNTVTDIKIEPGEWYPVKITMQGYDVIGNNSYVSQMFEVQVGNQVVISANADNDWVAKLYDALEYDVEPVAEGGTWFLSALAIGSPTNKGVMNSLAFKGTGAISSLAVTREPVYAVNVVTECAVAGAPTIELTVNSILSDGPFTYGTEVTASYTADSDYTFMGWLVTTNGQNLSYSIVNDTTITFIVYADTKVTAVFNYVGGAGVPTDYDNIPGGYTEDEVCMVAILRSSVW